MREYWSLAASLEHPTLDDIRYSEGWSQLSTSPDHVTFEAYSKSGVDGLLITPDNARRDVLLLCLHGGGLFSGSAASSDRKSVVLGKKVSVGVDLGGGRINHKKKKCEKRSMQHYK